MEPTCSSRASGKIKQVSSIRLDELSRQIRREDKSATKEVANTKECAG